MAVRTVDQKKINRNTHIGSTQSNLEKRMYGQQYTHTIDRSDEWVKVPKGIVFFDLEANQIYKIHESGYRQDWFDYKDYADNLVGSKTKELFIGGRDNTVTSSYLKNAEVYMNLTPIVTAKDLVIDSIAASSNGEATWVAEIHNDGVLIENALVEIIVSDNGIATDLNISIPAGTRLMFFANGELIDKPKITLTCK